MLLDLESLTLPTSAWQDFAEIQNELLELLASDEAPSPDDVVSARISSLVGDLMVLVTPRTSEPISDREPAPDTVFERRAELVHALVDVRGATGNPPAQDETRAAPSSPRKPSE
jgi:hypothetical protein